MKICSKCKVEKDFSEFHKNKSKKDGVNHICKVCRTGYHKVWYAQNSDLQKSRVSKNRKPVGDAIKEFILNFLLENPCVQCGEKDPVVLEFDHLNDKKYSISAMYNFSLKKVKEEISKCQVLCANCHRRKTAKDFGYFKYRKLNGAERLGT